MELKEIEISKVYPNWFQPRKQFDKEKIKELSESILSNGLINPITIKSWRDNKFMIVSGERRWRAHKVAGLKTIQAIVKEYKDDGQFMIDSLIENVHREDLSPTEKGKFCLKIKKQMKLENNEQVANVVKKPTQHIDNWIDDYEFTKGKDYSRVKQPAHAIIRSTKSFPDEERKKLIAFAEKKKMRSDDFEEEFVPVYKKSDEPTKKALLSGKVTIEDVKKESIPEPLKLERTANNIGDDILSDMSNLDYHIKELMEDVNPADLSKSKMERLMTTSGLLVHKHIVRLVRFLHEKGAKADSIILALIKANGKV